MTTAFHKLRYTEGACHAYNDRHVKRWIILRTFPKCFFIVVSNYGFAFTNQFSRCSAINFRANGDIAATLVVTSHHMTSLHIKEDKKARKVSTITIDVVRHAICQVLGLILSSRWRFLRKERTWWVTHQWCGTSKDYFTKKFYSRMIDTEDSVKVPRYDFLFLTITFQTFINLYHPDPK